MKREQIEAMRRWLKVVDGEAVPPAHAANIDTICNLALAVADDVPATAWLIERPKGYGKQQTVEREVVLSPLTDDTYMDEGDTACPLYIRSSDIKLPI